MRCVDLRIRVIFCVPPDDNGDEMEAKPDVIVHNKWHNYNHNFDHFMRRASAGFLAIRPQKRPEGSTLPPATW
ncbi:MAG: hypothetical protein DCC68_05575 [Planctomycetota bacterium]|nr:MAG: hypothetical protein DCC68_05575 [Planctomycetota bacterium]